jgi:riboflavin biosynthesis pyrimidine reductase
VSELEPFEVLFEELGLAAVELPGELRRLYGGDLGLREPCLYANFVSTVDGVVAIPAIRNSNAVIAAGSEADKLLMGVLRAFADVVLIGAGVLRAAPKGTWQPAAAYPPAAEAFAELRRRLGRSEGPVVAVLTGHGTNDPAHPVLEAGALVLTSEPGAAALEAELPPAATLITLSDDPVVDGRAVRDALLERGHRSILAEAGPHAFGSLLEAGAIDELFLTVSPTLAGDTGPGSRLHLVEAADLVPLHELRPVSLRRHGRHLFARYEVGGGESAE